MKFLRCDKDPMERRVAVFVVSNLTPSALELDGLVFHAAKSSNRSNLFALEHEYDVPIRPYEAKSLVLPPPTGEGEWILVVRLRNPHASDLRTAQWFYSTVDSLRLPARIRYPLFERILAIASLAHYRRSQPFDLKRPFELDGRETMGP